jgi:Leucine-rich repeat (LRR) protein
MKLSEYYPDIFSNPLDVKHLDLCKLPIKVNDLSELASFQNLERLEYNAFLHPLPREVFELPHLHTLVVYNLYKKFNDNILGLKHLRHLIFLSHWNVEFPDSFEQFSQLESLIFHSPFGVNNFPKSILKLTQLKKIKFELYDWQALPVDALLNQPLLEDLQIMGTHLTKPILNNITQLKQLRKLKIIQNTDYNVPKNMTFLPQLPIEFGNLSQLQSLRLTIQGIKRLPNSLNQIKQLQALSLADCSLVNFPWEAENLQHLQKLNLDYQSKLPINEILKRLTVSQLNELNLAHCELKTIPDELFELVNLQKLNLKSNRIAEIPYEWVKLKNLQELDINHNPIAPKTDFHSGANWLKINELCNLNKADDESRKYYLALLTRDEDFFPQIPTDFLWANLNFPHSLIRLRVTGILQKRISSPFTPDFAQTKPLLMIIGKIKARKINDLIAKLSQAGIASARKLSPEVTHIVVGEDSGEKWAEAQKIKAKLILPQHLIDFLENEQKPYLRVADSEATQNLKNLLLSQEFANFQLAIQLMQAGGIPNDLFYYVIVLYLHKNEEARQLLKKLIAKYLDNNWLEATRKYGRKLFPGAIQGLLTENYVEAHPLLQATLDIVGQDSENSWYYAKIVAIGLKLNHEIISAIIERHLQDTFLDLSHLQLSKLPLALQNYSQITTINLNYNWFSQFPKVLSLLPNLKKLHLYNNRLITEKHKETWQKKLPQVAIIWDNK